LENANLIGNDEGSMSRILAEMVGANEPAFSKSILQLEQASGRPGVDVRLLAEMATTVHRKIRELGLDPSDTTAKELYHGLQALIGLHESFLAAKVGATDPHDAVTLLPKIQQIALELPLPKKSWAIKHSVIKKLLKDHPPKKLMKQLGYKSIDSMLKREPAGMLVTATRFAESSAWQSKLLKSYKKLRPSDFEPRDVEIMVLDRQRWGNVANKFILEKHHNIAHSKEAAVILILPLPVAKMRGLILTVLPLVLHYMNEIRLYAAYFKLEQVKPHFADRLVQALEKDISESAFMAGQAVHWRTIARHFGRKRRPLPAVFEPHVQLEDLAWRKAEDILYRIEPALKFWEKLDYTMFYQDDSVVPLNLLDNAISYCNDLDYGQHVSIYGRSSLLTELYARYLGQEGLEQEVLQQLDNELIELDEALVGL
jgi:hypothetical protein